MVTVQLDDLVLIAGIVFHPLVLGIQEAYKSRAINHLHILISKII